MVAEWEPEGLEDRVEDTDELVATFNKLVHSLRNRKEGNAAGYVECDATVRAPGFELTGGNPINPLTLRAQANFGEVDYPPTLTPGKLGWWRLYSQAGGVLTCGPDGSATGSSAQPQITMPGTGRSQRRTVRAYPGESNTWECQRMTLWECTNVLNTVSASAGSSTTALTGTGAHFLVSDTEIFATYDGPST